MANHSGTVIESQVDWLTVSAHGEASARNMLDLALGLAEEEKAHGARERRWRLMGYEGSHVGRIEYGQRDAQSTILRLIGDPASANLDVAMSLADSVTRVDLATTWRAEPPDPFLGRNEYALAEMFHSQHPNSARPWFTGDANGGYTCYLGNRQSDRFLRIYNKGAECVATHDDEGAERYRACWRFELEAKASMAGTLAQMVTDREDRADYIRRYLVSFVEAHGMLAPFVDGQSVALLPGFRRRSDEESRLKHIARNVRPTADWLRSRGRENDLREALGFDRTASLLRELQWLLDTDPDRVRKRAETESGTPEERHVQQT